MIARTSAAASPLRAITRRTCSSSGQSTTSTRSTPEASAALEQQRDDEQPVGLVQAADFPARGVADQRMQNRFEPGARVGVVEHVPAQATAVERPVGRGERGTERSEHRVVAGLSRAR